MPMPFCPFCGSQVSEDDRFCQRCGSNLDGADVVRTPVYDATERGRRSWVPAAIMAILLLSAAVGAIVVMNLPDRSDDVHREFQWEYGNHTFSYVLDVPGEQIEKMKSTKLQRAGSISTDDYVDIGGDTVYAVGNYIVVDRYIKGLVESLEAQYIDEFGTVDRDGFAKFVVAFVQICIEYDYDEYGNEYDYWRFPLETLCDGTGDCEDTSILMAALLNGAGYEAGIVLLPGHAMCAIETSSLSGVYAHKYHSNVYGVDFYLIETTRDEYEGIGVRSNSDQYCHYYKGISEDYLTS